ncbi:MAG TPA: sigma-70 family RNA polymerase sigma factor [Caulobacteraceae bacterium]
MGAPRTHTHENRTADLAARLDARYRTALMSYFLRRVRDRAEAEDLTQEVFLRIVQRPAQELENAEVFLFTIAGNLLRDRARRAATRHARAHQSLDAPSDEPISPSLIEARAPDRVLMSQESLSEVLRALDELGERTRDIFILYRLEKMKHREIGALYGLSASAVEKYVRKATAHLARLFGER